MDDIHPIKADGHSKTNAELLKELNHLNFIFESIINAPISLRRNLAGSQLPHQSSE